MSLAIQQPISRSHSDISQEVEETPDSRIKKQKCALSSCSKTNDTHTIFINCQTCLQQFCVKHLDRKLHGCILLPSPVKIVEGLKAREVVYKANRLAMRTPALSPIGKRVSSHDEAAFNITLQSPAAASAEKLRKTVADRNKSKPLSRGDKMIAAILQKNGVE